MNRKAFEVEIEHNGEKGVFTVDPLTPEELSKLIKKHTKRAKPFGARPSEPETNWLEMRIEKIQRTIQSWDVKDEEGNEIECNNENKRIAFLLNPELINKVIAEADILGQGIEEEDIEDLKNLLGG
jgi:hypothetical protein